MTVLRALVVAATLAVATTATAPADASRVALQTSRAVVNISGNNNVIAFSGSISGIEALRRVAPNVETLSYGGQGAAVCKINGVGNPAVQGQCLGEKSGKYWSYWRAAPGATKFSYSGSGAGGTSVSDGAVEGWNFGNGPPPFSSFCSVAGCAPPPPPPTAAVPAATAAPTPAAAATPGGAGPASGSGSATGALPGQVGVSGASAGGTGTSSGGSPGDTSATASTTPDGGASTSTSTTSGKDRARRAARQRRNQERAAGPINIQADDDSGTPWGVIAAGVGAVALGTGGFVIRSRRRSTPG